jgi:hypothetical protein
MAVNPIDKQKQYTSDEQKNERPKAEFIHDAPLFVGPQG